MRLMSRGRHVARKDHQCDLCGHPIATGTTYERQRVVDGPDAWTFKGHVECCLASWWAQDEFGYQPEEEMFGQDFVTDTLMPYRAQLEATTGTEEVAP